MGDQPGGDDEVEIRDIGEDETVIIELDALLEAQDVDACPDATPFEMEEGHENQSTNNNPQQPPNCDKDQRDKKGERTPSYPQTYQNHGTWYPWNTLRPRSGGSKTQGRVSE